MEVILKFINMGGYSFFYMASIYNSINVNFFFNNFKKKETKKYKKIW